MVFVKNFRYKKSGDTYIQQGLKKYQVPKRAIGGGNGTFVISGEPPKAMFQIEDQETTNNVNFYPIIKQNSSRRITEKYCQKIYDNIKNQKYDSLEELQDAIIANCE